MIFAVSVFAENQHMLFSLSITINADPAVFPARLPKQKVPGGSTGDFL
jgi:hypothetical protein